MKSPAPIDCWYLSGPTASGKTSVALELAARLQADIISMDSMALYRGMDIGTAKPTAEEQARVRHHLIDVLGPDEEYSVAQYVATAEQKVREILAAGRQALFVGGTPLYLKSLLRGIFTGPPADWTLRRTLAELARREGPAALHRRLAEVDPAAAAKLHPNDARRLIRALEVFETTGQPISQRQQHAQPVRPASQLRVFVLQWPRDVLHARIDDRVERMFDAGLVNEVRRLVARERPPSRTASQALGYRETIEHLQGARSLAETIELVKTRTRQFAKRQMTWFRSLEECRAVELSGEMDAARVAERIAAAN